MHNFAQFRWFYLTILDNEDLKKGEFNAVP